MIAQHDRPGAPASAAPDDDHFVSIVDVVKRFGDTTAVRHVDLHVRRNELFALLGSSGCGKSTLLRMLAGFETPSAGRILIDGQDMADLPPYRRPVNMMFQSYALFPHMNVAANVAFGLKQERLPRAEIRERVAAALELVQMSAFEKRRPDQLSGGQQQRVALARSLVKRPKLLLLDEPMSALDKQIRQRTQMELVEILQRVGVTCIMVTHDQEEAMTMAHRIAVMDEGQIRQIGRPQEVYEYPNCRFVARFIGSTNLFEGRVVEDEPDHVHIESPALERRLYINHGITGPLGMAVTVSVRPEKMVLTREAPTVPYNWTVGSVVNIAYLGAYSLYQVRTTHGGLLTAQVTGSSLAPQQVPALGDTVYLRWGAASGVVLSA